MKNCLSEYLQRYGKLLGQAASRATRPLHTPGVDQLIKPALLREPYPAQAHLITAGIKALNRQRALQVSASCGTGKTLVSQGICQGHAEGGYRALVLCPPHLTAKWEREILETVKNAHVHQIESFKDLLPLRRDAKPCGRGWWVVSNTKAKMGPKWRPAFITHRYRPGIAFCPKCHSAQDRQEKDRIEHIPLAEFFKKKLFCTRCQEPLWQWTSEINRWPIATYIHKRLPGWFRYCVVDESHEGKSAETAVGQAMGSLIAACDKAICLTGTLVGGYAWHVRPLLFRIAPSSLVQEGLTWENELAFNERYGRIEKRIVETESRSGGFDNKQSRGRTCKTAKFVRPGVMPGLFGRHLIQNTVFLSLEDVAENLPAIEERVVPVKMDARLAEAYLYTEQNLRTAVKEMLRRRDKRMLSQMLEVLLGYCDHPYGWKEVGYYDYNQETGANIWQHVVDPPQLDSEFIRPKEQALIETCLAEKAAGRQVWVYSVMTDARDVNERLRKLLSDIGLRVAVLRSDVESKEREAWIAENGPKLDVCISHPKLVQTGLDFYAKDRSYNFPTLWFHSTGTSTFVVRQAARRAWRLTQWADCKVLYACYEGTMQQHCLEHMARKQQASESIEGDFSTEGLKALCGEDGSIELALARTLVERLDQDRGWQKVRR
jgi:hypothetical protein